MLPFFFIFLAFIVIITLQIRKSDRAQETINRNFWDREQKANTIRRQDISTLDYIYVPTELIIGTLHTEAEQTLLSLEGRKMLNLTGLTNTDLKLKYGVANLNELTGYESDYVKMIPALSTYSKELIEAGETDCARKLLEFAIECGENSDEIYLTLAEQYKSNGEIEKIEELIHKAEKITTLGKKGLADRIRKFL